MKVVLLAGGLGTRMREETEFRPKPMVEIGGEPLLWHIMKNFAAYGISEFVVCAGYKGELIDNYFAPQNWIQKSEQLCKSFPTGVAEPDWSVTVLDTGLETPTGGRLKAAGELVADDRFICTYGDGLAPVDISRLSAQHEQAGVLSTVTLARPSSRFGIAEVDASGLVRSFREKPQLDELVSIGFFVFEPQVLSLLDEDSVLEEQPVSYLASSRNLSSFIHQGFWQPIDTYRELLQMQKLWDSGSPPWSP